MKSSIKGTGMKYAGIMVFLLWLCTGCGIQNQARDAADAVAGSGSAVRASVHIQEASIRSDLCNGKNYYESVYGKNYYENWTICQMEMDGTKRQEFPMKENGALAFVTEDELFYTTFVVDYEKTQVWCAPLRHTESGDVPQFEKAKKLLTEEKDVSVHSCFYANDQYVMYITSCYELRIFDRIKGEFLKIKDVSDKKSRADNNSSMKDSKIGDTFYFGCKYSGIYSYTLGDKKLKQINKRTHGAYQGIVCPEQNLLLYEDCKGCDGKTHGEIVLCSYDCKTGEKKEFMTGQQWKKIYQDMDMWRVYQERWCEEAKEYSDEKINPEDAPLPNPKIYVDGKNVYAIGECGFAFLLDLTGDQKPHYEKELSEFLHSRKYDYWDIKKIDQGVCYFEHEEYKETEDEEEVLWDKIIYGYYDMAENKYVQTKVVEDE